MDFSVTHHPDKAGGDEEKLAAYATANEQHALVKEAFDAVGNKNDEGEFEDRVKYDREGEALRAAFLAEFEKVHQGKTFADRCAETDEELKRAEIYKKAAVTREKAKDLSHIDRVLKSWESNGQQYNACRKAILDAIYDGDVPQADIIRAVRLHVYSTKNNPWDGVARKDKICEKIRAVIKRTMEGEKARLDAGLCSIRELTGKDLRSKSMMIGARGRKVLSPVKKVSHSHSIRL